MGDLAPRTEQAAALSYAAAKQLGRLQAAALIQRARIDAAEQAAAYQADRRIENGYVIASRLVQNAGELSREITAAARDNAGLELTLRRVEEEVAFDAAAIIRQYMRRP